MCETGLEALERVELGDDCFIRWNSFSLVKNGKESFDDFSVMDANLFKIPMKVVTLLF